MIEPIPGDHRELKKRNISLDTVAKFDYRIGEHKGENVQIATYRDAEGRVVAEHIRTKDKKFRWVGNVEDIELFGQHLWQKGGKRVVITEGEIDCMSVSQIFGLKWPVVSLPSGVQSAEKYLKINFEWLQSFDEIVIAFDNDEPGREAAHKVAPLFKAGTVKIADFSPHKDASDFLQAGKTKELATVIFQAKEYRPDGIIAGSALTFERLRKNTEVTFSYDLPYPKLNEKLRGFRKAEIHMLAAGSGLGKSTLAREIAAHLSGHHSLSIGYVALEESVDKTALGLMAIDLNVPMGALFTNRELVSDEAFEQSRLRMVDNGRTFFYDHFGSLENDNLLSKLRYMAVSCGVDFIVLDHISIVVSGIEDGDERRIIDNLMTQLRSLVEATGVGVIAITHLKVPEGVAHEEGGRVTMSQLRGSGSIKQLSDNIIALERDQQGAESDISDIRLLKNRLFGDVGMVDTLRYYKDTGRLLLGEHEKKESKHENTEDTEEAMF